MSQDQLFKLSSVWSRRLTDTTKKYALASLIFGPPGRLLIPTRNSSGDEIANVNFLYDDIVHALKIQ